MTDNVENLLLEHMKRFQAAIDRVERKQDEHTQRLGRIESKLVSLRNEIGQNEEAWAEQSVRIDRLTQRLDRIERRLEISG